MVQCDILVYNVHTHSKNSLNFSMWKNNYRDLFLLVEIYVGVKIIFEIWITFAIQINLYVLIKKFNISEEKNDNVKEH